MKLNIGCGGDIKPKSEGWINLDRRKWNDGVDVVRDLKRGLPFDNDTFEYIYASNVFEHIPQGEEVYFVLSECYRVLLPGGILYINVPHSSTGQAFYPDHVSYWNEGTVGALLGDPYQSYGEYHFDLVEMKRGETYTYELLITLKKKV